MSVLRLRGNTWHVEYYDELKGRNNTKSTRCKKEQKGKAEKFKQKFDAQLYAKENGFIKISEKEARFSLKEGLVLYLDHLKKSSPVGLPIKTEQHYNTSINSFISICGDKPVYLYSPVDQDKFTTALFTKGKAYNTRASYLRDLHAYWAWLLSKEKVKSQIFTLMKKDKKDHATPIPTDEVSLWLEFLQPRYPALYLLSKFLVTTALRANEAIKWMTWFHIDKSKMEMKVNNTKVHREDMLPLIGPAQEVIEEIKAANLGKDGKLFHWMHRDSAATQWDNAFEKYCVWLDETHQREPSMKYTMHKLRKSCASYLLERDVNPIYVQRYLRDTDMKVILDYYAKVERENMRKQINKKASFKYVQGK